MRTAGIICEYNPFHRGHQLQIEATRANLGQDAAIVCLMSGNYVQRGEPAVFPKHLRAKAAVLGGADLVLELPITVAVNSAGYFARGAVICLDALGCIDVLSFGSECGRLPDLTAAARLLSSKAYDAALRDALKSGCSYAAAREKAVHALGGTSELLQSPNNALGIDYLQALLSLNSAMAPFTVPRAPELPAAGDIRAAMSQSDWFSLVPYHDIYVNQPFHTLDHGARAMLAVLRSLPDSAFQQMAFESEGLWSKVMKACRRENSLEGILMACKSKRFALSRLRRTLLCLYLGLGQAEMDLEIPYLRVLAFNETGQKLLARMRNTSALPLISGAVPNAPEARRYFDLENRAADLYSFFAPEDIPLQRGTEKAAKPEIIFSQITEKQEKSI